MGRGEKLRHETVVCPATSCEIANSYLAGVGQGGKNAYTRIREDVEAAEKHAPSCNCAVCVVMIAARKQVVLAIIERLESSRVAHEVGLHGPSCECEECLNLDEDTFYDRVAFARVQSIIATLPRVNQPL